MRLVVHVRKALMVLVHCGIGGASTSGSEAFDHPLQGLLVDI